MTELELVEAEIEKQERICDAEIASRDILEFSRVTFPEVEGCDFVTSWFHKIIAREIWRWHTEPDYPFLMIFMPPRHGKQISHETPVLTLNGWVRHGDLAVGDYVFGCDGEPKEVQAISRESPQDYEIGFSDGSVIHCHANHEWRVCVTRNKWRTMETKHIARLSLESGGSEKKRGHRYNFQVAGFQCVHFPKAKLLIDPYVLGVWLGDGTTTKNCISYCDSDEAVIRKCADLGYN